MPADEAAAAEHEHAVDRRRAVADAFSAGEAARAEAATKGKKAVVAALKAVKASK